MEFDLNKAANLLLERVETWLEVGFKNIPNLIVAIAIFVFFIFLAKMAKKLIHRALPRVSQNVAVNNLFESVLGVAVLLIGAFIALEVLSLDKAVTSILAGVGVLGLALGFAFQEIASNFVAGILIAFREPYKVGDYVQIDDFFGEVTKINLRITSIMTFQGLEVLVPNKKMFTEPLTNFTTTPIRRIDLPVGVSYGDDLEKVEKITVETIKGMEWLVPDKDIDFWYTGFGASSIDFEVRFWIEYPGKKNFLKARHEAIKRIKKAFDENDITIPFPIRTLDFGIKGGETLTESVGGFFNGKDGSPRSAGPRDITN